MNTVYSFWLNYSLFVLLSLPICLAQTADWSNPEAYSAESLDAIIQQGSFSSLPDSFWANLESADEKFLQKIPPEDLAENIHKLQANPSAAVKVFRTLSIEDITTLLTSTQGDEIQLSPILSDSTASQKFVKSISTISQLPISSFNTEDSQITYQNGIIQTSSQLYDLQSLSNSLSESSSVDLSINSDGILELNTDGGQINPSILENTVIDIKSKKPLELATDKNTVELQGDLRIEDGKMFIAQGKEAELIVKGNTIRISATTQVNINSQGPNSIIIDSDTLTIQKDTPFTLTANKNTFRFKSEGSTIASYNLGADHFIVERTDAPIHINGNSISPYVKIDADGHINVHKSYNGRVPTYLTSMEVDANCDCANGLPFIQIFGNSLEQPITLQSSEPVESVINQFRNDGLSDSQINNYLLSTTGKDINTVREFYDVPMSELVAKEYLLHSTQGEERFSSLDTASDIATKLRAVDPEGTIPIGNKEYTSAELESLQKEWGYDPRLYEIPKGGELGSGSNPTKGLFSGLFLAFAAPFEALAELFGGTSSRLSVGQIPKNPNNAPRPQTAITRRSFLGSGNWKAGQYAFENQGGVQVEKGLNPEKQALSLAQGLAPRFRSGSPCQRYARTCSTRLGGAPAVSAGHAWQAAHNYRTKYGARNVQNPRQLKAGDIIYGGIKGRPNAGVTWAKRTGTSPLGVAAKYSDYSHAAAIIGHTRSGEPLVSDVRGGKVFIYKYSTYTSHIFNQREAITFR